ncbi:MAG: TrkA family potassium uptake protein [Candidatus Micrarchaeia archaeon]
MGKVLIIGAGKVGRTLLDILEQRKHKIWVVEEQREVCNELASEKSASVVHGDATDPTVLDEMDLQGMDYVFAVSTSDEANFLAGAYCKQAGSKRVICRVNSIKHSQILEKMGIESVVSELTLASELANRVSSPVIYKLLNPIESKMEFVEKDADESGFVGKSINEIEKNNFLIIAIYNNGKYSLAKDIERIPKDSKLVILRETGLKLF